MMLVWINIRHRAMLQMQRTVRSMRRIQSSMVHSVSLVHVHLQASQLNSLTVLKATVGWNE